LNLFDFFLYVFILPFWSCMFFLQVI
jgi:hypothetical protein